MGMGCQPDTGAETMESWYMPAWTALSVFFFLLPLIFKFRKRMVHGPCRHQVILFICSEESYGVSIYACLLLKSNRSSPMQTSDLI